MALAVTPGRDPDETPDDLVVANIVAAVFVLLAVAFVVWLAWVYL
jgi:ribosomal protein L11 methylase PrmA